MVSLRWRLSVVCQHFQTSSPQKTAGRIKAKCHMKPPWTRETKVSSRERGHMAKMAAIYTYMVKTLKKSSSPEPLGRLP